MKQETKIITKLFIVALMLIGGGNSAWGQKSLPYSYDFENNDLAAEGWTTSPSYSMTKIASSADYGTVFHSGSYCFRFYYNSSYTPQYLISPKLENSTTEIDVSFYYTCNNGSDKVKFKVGYSTTNAEIGSFTFGDEIVVTKDADWHLYSNSFTTGTKYIAIQFTATDYRLFIDDVSIEISETYKRPKSLAVSSLTASSATLSWTNGDDESAWQIAYSTKKDFDPDTEGTKVSVKENPYNLMGLIEGVTYYAYVRSNYSENYSAWSNVVRFQPQNELVLNGSASSTNANIPVPNYTNNSSYLTKSQIIIPYSELSDIKGNYITQLTFYANSSTIDWGTATYDIYLAETTTSYFTYSATFIDWENCSKVMENTNMSVSDSKLVLNLSTPFLYSGSDNKNLLIGFQQKSTSATSVSSSWYVDSKTPETSQYYCAAYYNSGSYTYTTGQSYVPKITITTTSPTVPVTLGTNGYTTFACPRPLDLTAANLPTGLKAYKAAVYGDKVKFTEINQAVQANTGMLLEGEAGETYDIPVAESGAAPDGNEFLVNSVGGTFPADANYTYYGLMKNTLTFGTFEPDSVAIPTNKAYLKVADVGGEARQLVCVFGDDESETTAIRSVGVQTNRNGRQYYDLQGRRVANPTKGVYVVDGKKLIVR
ncbi:MAG: hypothetical protein IJV34_08480 [Prevotella sp.]|nr:hypothetical protein [Prevotella sp.]